jgi:hypothetical protein
MYGLVVLGILLLYIIFCIVMVWLAIRVTRRFHWLTRLMSGLLMLILYNSPVGYHILPAIIARAEYCPQSGFWLYKTPEQWKLENPGVAETLRPDGEQVNTDSTRIFHLNARFDWRIEGKKITHNFYQEIQTVVDRKTGEIMAKRIDFNARATPIYAPETCFKKSERNRWGTNGKAFGSYLTEFGKFGE